MAWAGQLCQLPTLERLQMLAQRIDLVDAGAAAQQSCRGRLQIGQGQPRGRQSLSRADPPPEIRHNTRSWAVACCARDATRCWAAWTPAAVGQTGVAGLEHGDGRRQRSGACGVAVLGDQGAGRQPLVQHTGRSAPHGNSRLAKAQQVDVLELIQVVHGVASRQPPALACRKTAVTAGP